MRVPSAVAVEDKSFDSDGLAHLLHQILLPWTCLRCRLDWMADYCPRFTGMALSEFENEPHSFASGCSRTKQGLYRNAGHCRGDRRVWGR